MLTSGCAGPGGSGFSLPWPGGRPGRGEKKLGCPEASPLARLSLCDGVGSEGDSEDVDPGSSRDARVPASTAPTLPY